MKPGLEFKNKSKPVKCDIQWYNCGDKNTKKINSRHRKKGPFCFSCKFYIHKPFYCSKAKKKNVNKVNVVISS